MTKHSQIPPEPRFADAAVAAAFDAFPMEVRGPLLRLRALIFQVAAETPGVGVLEETLKWGEPAYLTPDTKSGSTIRLGVPKTGGFAIYAHCQTSIISDFATAFPDEFDVEGNRAVRFAEGSDVPSGPIAMLIRNALTYHLR